jgi:hypothetical protein
MKKTLHWLFTDHTDTTTACLGVILAWVCLNIALSTVLYLPMYPDLGICSTVAAVILIAGIVWTRRSRQ